MSERRRDYRVGVDLPFRLCDEAVAAQWFGTTINISPTGMLVRLVESTKPALGAIVNAAVQGRAERGWEHLNSRPMRVVRVGETTAALVYTEFG